MELNNVFGDQMLTGEQIRAARALARIEQAELARRCGLSIETIKRLERIRGPVEANTRTLKSLAVAFESLGIRFEGPDGKANVVGVYLHSANDVRPSEFRAREPGAANNVGKLYRLIFYSTATPATTKVMKAAIDEIHSTASARNAALGVTGVLYVCNGRFLQVLEGEKETVQQLFGAISSDNRHFAVHVLEGRSTTSRQFNDWSLCCGVFPSDMYAFSREPAVANGFQPELLTPFSALGLLTLMRDLQKSPPRCQRGSPGDCSLVDECRDRVCVTHA